MAVRCVGVRSRVNGRSCSAVVLPSSPPGNKNKNGCNDGHHENKSGDGDADGKRFGRQAELVGVVQLFSADFSGLLGTVKIRLGKLGERKV